MSDVIRTIGKNGVQIDEYKGEISLIGLYEGNDGEFRKQWVKFHKGKDEYQAKDWPLKLMLGGNKPTAVSVLKTLIAQLESADPINDADTPF